MFITKAIAKTSKDCIHLLTSEKKRFSSIPVLHSWDDFDRLLRDSGWSRITPWSTSDDDDVFEARLERWAKT